MFASEGMRILRTPVRAPPANAIAERWIGTARRELLDRMLILNRHHLMTVLTEYGRTSTTIARTVRSTKQHHLGHYHDRRRHPNITSNDAIHSAGCYTNTPRSLDVDDQFGTHRPREAAHDYPVP